MTDKKELPKGDIVFFDGRGDAVDGYSAAKVREMVGALQAALEAQAQEPIGEVRWAGGVVGSFREVVFVGGIAPPVGTKLFASPVVQQPVPPEQVEAAWRAGWAACRDAEYVGEEAENEAWGMSQTCASADLENASPVVQQPLTNEQKQKLWVEACEKATRANWVNAFADAVEAAHGIGGHQ